MRVFVAFAKMESATKAVIGLNNRFFAGRPLIAQFYSEEKFAARQLDLDIAKCPPS